MKRKDKTNTKAAKRPVVQSKASVPTTVPVAGFERRILGTERIERTSRKLTPIRVIWIANTVFALFLAYLNGGLTSIQTSILERDPNVRQERAFDGTTYPIAFVPDWNVARNTNKSLTFDQFLPSDFVELPKYDSEKLETGGKSAADFQLRYTYPIVYMGSYRGNYLQYDGSHPATDIRAPIGTPVLSIANGVIVKVKSSEGADGKYVVIRHEIKNAQGEMERLYSSYLHLSETLATVGSQVTKGDIIGKVGMTGITTTPHLHFQIDKESATNHPYWAYTTSEAQSVGLGFFEAVNMGLGKENAMALTVNPLDFVQTNGMNRTDSENASTALSDLPELKSAPVAEPLVPVAVAQEPTGQTLSVSIVRSGVTEENIVPPAEVESPFVTNDTSLYSDLSATHPMYPLVRSLVDRSVLPFDTERKFEEKRGVTRAELIRFLVKYQGMKSLESSSATTFEDIASTDAFYPWANKAVEMGILSSLKVRPNDPATRAELFTFLARALKFEGEAPSRPRFGDVPASSAHFASIQKLSQAMKIGGKSFQPESKIRRIDLLKVISLWEKRK